MTFKLPESYYIRQKEIHDRKYINYKGDKIHVSEFRDKSITSEMKSSMRMNSYAQSDLPPKLTDTALIETVEYYLTQCSRPRTPSVTYDDAIVHNLVPELINRLKEYKEV
ncbi:hypothetical protein JOC34_000603 [Virgibacillus halotolerans]|uniref:hypothetical protein n=1 Tax=Virgibacillus halotolerans TaxID=1071053 RepID=UPI00195F2F44|nr:hypothetical protein [Virgibacillus halotolerans]MBM7598246.1 hypothetical protein [Virgibacillus halotolerans]